MPFFIPGMLVIIDPYVGSSEPRFGNDDYEESSSWKVGLMGYYMITKVNHTLKKGKAGDITAKTEIVTKNILGYGKIVSVKSEQDEEVDDCDKYLGLTERLGSDTGITLGKEEIATGGIEQSPDAVEEYQEAEKEREDRENRRLGTGSSLGRYGR